MVALLSLTACSGGVRHDTKDYVLDLDYTSNFRMLQLTDIHIGDKDQRAIQFKYLDKVITEANANMIVVTGDLFTFASKDTAKELFDFLESYNLPWTVTFGNHDEQCNFSISWLTSYLNNYGKHCYFRDIQDDDVFGYANFAINLKRDGKIFEQLIIMDSNRYDFKPPFGYDHFKQNQIDWYERLVTDSATETWYDSQKESIMFYHIPLPEIDEAWDAYQAGSTDAEYIMGDKREKCCPPDYNSHFFDKILELGSTKAMFFGHDHVNDFIIKYKGVIFGYGINSTNRIYYEDGLIGGRVITLHDDHSLSFDDILVSYEEVL